MLRDYREGGPALYLMHGNRDFLLGESFCRDVGAALLPDPTTTELYGIPTLLLHGDTLCTRDVDYQRFRASARDPDWQAALLSRPLAERRRLAGELRQLSREATGDKAPEIMDVTPEEVEHSFSRHGVGRMIHGHTHRPGHHRHRAGERWVLGDWGRRGWYLELTSTGAELKNFPIFS